MLCNGLIVENNRPTMFNNGYLIESKRLAFWLYFIKTFEMYSLLTLNVAPLLFLTRLCS